MNIQEYLRMQCGTVEKALDQLMLKEEGALADHVRAMRYSLFAGGKRIRPILCMAAAEALACDPAPFMPIACAFECIHTYSLIHDDLPAMDNDDLRRGKPTSHKVFGEAGAILAGDGLLTYAFELLSSAETAAVLSAEKLVAIMHLIARASGSMGMVGGQSLDLAAEGKEIPFDRLRLIHSLKTGALITAAVQTGAILGNATEAQYNAITAYGEHIGLAFQIADDLLNVTGSTEELGKAAGSDAERQKATYPAFFGVEQTRSKAHDAAGAAVSALKEFDHHADPLRELAKYIIYRTN